MHVNNDQKSPALWRNAMAFFLFGLANNLPFPLMISASKDIIKFDNNAQNISRGTNSTDLQCFPDLGKPRCETLMSTGAVLLADILPSFTIKCALFFFMNRIPYSFRHFFVCSLQVACFLLLGFSTAMPTAMVGVAFGSAAAGFGEICFLALTSYYDRSAFLAWSIGLGCSGIVASVAYAALTEQKLLAMSPQNAILLMLIIPILYFLTYWIVLLHSPLMHKAKLLRPSTWVVPAIRRPSFGQDYASGNGISCAENGIAGVTHQFEFWQKLKTIKPLLRYMIPVCIISLFDYLINSGLLQHVKFNCAHSIDLSLPSQFRWFQTFHLSGFFFSRLSAIFVEIPSPVLYSLPFLMFVNLAIFLGQSLFSFIPHILLVFAIIFFEGIIFGASYTFFGKVLKKASPEAKEFGMSVISLCDSVGITLAAFLSISAHNSICQLYQTIYP